MKVTILKDYSGLKKGVTKEVTKEIGQILINKKVAVEGYKLPVLEEVKKVTRKKRSK